MSIYRYDRRYWENHIQAHALEWVMTSGNGAYSGGTIAGGRNRTHQGYLVASLEPPTKRYVVLEEITEYVRLGDTDYDLESAIRKNGENADGYRFLKKMSYDGTVRFEYELRPQAPGSDLDCELRLQAPGSDPDCELRPQAPGSVPDCESGTCAMSVVKHIAMVRGENTLAVDYTLTNYSADKAEVYITPKFNLREHNTLTSAEDMAFDTILTGDTLSIVKAQPGNEGSEDPGNEGTDYSTNEGTVYSVMEGAEDSDNFRIDFSVSEGEYLELSEKYDTGRVLPIEVALETEGVCDFFMPYDIRIEVAPGESKHVSAVCSVVCAEGPGDRPGRITSALGIEITGGILSPGQLLQSATDRFVTANTAGKLIRQVREYYDGVEKTAVENLQGQTESDNYMEFFKRLVLDADHFIADRRSTGLKTVLAGLPWFTDWGRDTMIAFTGLTLCTGRYEDAREILKSFAMYERNGLIPNMFPDSGEEPLYNTADASLWYFIAVWNYIRYIEITKIDDISRSVKDESEMINGREPERKIRPQQTGPDSFIRDEIYPVLLKILDSYEHGTDNDIHMEPSGLIHAGSGTDQVTWMDVRVDGVCVTPRHGCPVEINALWYNALKIGAKLAADFGDEQNSVHFSKITDQIDTNFEQIYYNNEIGCLYDVVDGCIADPGSLSGYSYTKCDTSIRPNQLYAVSLPFSPVSESTARRIVDIVEERLYTGCGVRSLDPGHPDYHGQYRGALEKRDQSYHQGTAWGFLQGAYISAYAKVHAKDRDLTKRLKALFEPVIRHQSEENCIGGICEVFEGDEPNAGGGCYTQAWSTGEILRAYTEEIIRSIK